MFNWIFTPNIFNIISSCTFECRDGAYVSACDIESGVTCNLFDGCAVVECKCVYTGGSCISNTCNGQITFYGCSDNNSVFYGTHYDCNRLRCENHNCPVHTCGLGSTTYFCFNDVICNYFAGGCSGTACTTHN